MANDLTAFTNQTAARLEPDRSARWLTYWDTFSSTIPDEIAPEEYSDLALSAWLDFRKQDDAAQVWTQSRRRGASDSSRN